MREGAQGGTAGCGLGAVGTLSSMIVATSGSPLTTLARSGRKKTRPSPSDEPLPGVVVYFSAMLLFLLALFGVDIFKLVLRYFLAFTNGR